MIKRRNTSKSLRTVLVNIGTPEEESKEVDLPSFSDTSAPTTPRDSSDLVDLPTLEEPSFIDISKDKNPFHLRSSLQTNSPSHANQETISTSLPTRITNMSSSRSSSKLSKAEQQQLKLLKNTKSSIDSFVKTLFKKKHQPEDQRDDVLNFLEEMNNNITKTMNNINEMQSTSNEPSKFLFSLGNMKDELQTHLFSKIFNHMENNSKNKAEDEMLSKRFAQFQWMEPRHLDIPLEQYNSELWESALKEISSINSFSTPHMKLMSIMNCAKILIYLIEENGSPASADDFLPHLIYVVIRANMKHISTNIKFIQAFTEDGDMFGEIYYFFTHLVSAVTFIQKIDASSLNVTREEYQKHMGAAEDTSRSSPTTGRSRSSSQSSQEGNSVIGLPSLSSSIDVTSQKSSTRDRRNSVSSDHSSLSSTPRTPLGESPLLIGNRAPLFPDDHPLFNEVSSSNNNNSNNNTSSSSKPKALNMRQRSGGLDSLLDPLGITSLRSFSNSKIIETPKIERKKQKMEELAMQFPFLHYSLNDIKVSDIKDLLEGYKQLALMVASSNSSSANLDPKRSKLLGTRRFKVREISNASENNNETNYFKIIRPANSDLSSLHHAIKKRFDREDNCKIEKLIWLPNTLIETQEDLACLEDSAELQVLFSEGHQLTSPQRTDSYTDLLFSTHQQRAEESDNSNNNTIEVVSPRIANNDNNHPEDSIHQTES